MPRDLTKNWSRLTIPAFAERESRIDVSQLGDEFRVPMVDHVDLLLRERTALQLPNLALNKKSYFFIKITWEKLFFNVDYYSCLQTSYLIEMKLYWE